MVILGMGTFWGLEIGSWADWFSGIATFLAVVVTLVIQHNSNKKKLKVKSTWVYVAPGYLQGASVDITNTGKVPIQIQSAGLFVKGNRWQFIYNNPSKEEKYLTEQSTISFSQDLRGLVGTAAQKNMIIFYAKSYAKDSAGKMYYGKRFKVNIHNLIEMAKHE